MENRPAGRIPIVITSIFPPTEAIHAFAANENYTLIVAGDKKTPAGWNYDGVTYLSVDDQQGIGNHLNKLLPYNHYCRKMMGYLKAIADGAEYMVDTDDDNIPKEGWAFPAFEGTFDYISQPQGFVNVYQLYSDTHIWPRGLPLHLINTKFNLEEKITQEPCRIGIWQGLADEDPDVDAIYRLTNDTPCYFDERPPVVLAKDVLSPFNSQNTIVRKELFPLLYLPTYVTFRFTDILRSYVAQPIMWLNDYHLGFTNATVVQKRNPHDYFKDFLSEVPMYQHCNQVIETTVGAINAGTSIAGNLYNAYEALHKKDIVVAKELEVLEAWLKDI